MAESPLNQITEVVKAFLGAQTWGECKRIVESHRDQLLTHDADLILAGILEQYRDDANLIRLLEERRDLLAGCRLNGIEVAFADYLHTEESLKPLLNEIERLSSSGDISRRVELCRTALRVVNRDTQAQLWAALHGKLANSLVQTPLGKRVENLEQAIHHSEQALEIYTRQVFPEQWAVIQNSLGSAYRERIRGERAVNLEQAIYHYQQALQVHTRQASLEQWANTENNLALAYQDRIRGERANNLEQAILLLQQVLEVHTRQAFPQRWAGALVNLGNAYRERIRGERDDNLEQALNCHQQAFEVYTRQAFPEDWARIQVNLGNAYRERIRGERADNLEQAILLYQQALEEVTRQTFPELWGVVQNNLGTVYRERIHGERADNLEQAILLYQQALEVRTPLTFPQGCRDTAYSVGCLLYDERRFSEARQALDTAHRAVEALRGEMQRDVAKRSVAEENADLYARLVSCYLREEDANAAFACVVAGKGRAFVDLLATAHLDLSAASVNDSALADDLRKARELRQQIDALLATLTGESGSSLAGPSSAIVSETSSRSPLSSDALRAQLRTLQAQEARHWEEMTYKYPALTATQKAPLLSADQARTLAAELNATLVEYYRHKEGWCAFVVTANSMHHVPLPHITDGLLERIVTWMLRLEYATGRNRLSDLRLSEWYDAVVAPLEAHLPNEQPLVLAPFGLLHVLPMAAARHPKTGRYITEDYPLAFAPSLSALHILWEQVHRTGRDGQAPPHRLLSVAYPGTPDSDHYLPNVLPEAQAIASHFTQVSPLYQENATPEAVLEHSHDQDVIHFGCHGWFNAEQPEQSGLMLAGGWLTVQRIITELRLKQTHVVTLGACFSGRAAIQSGDEHVGLVQAMLTTSLQSVVASLWTVDDSASRALFNTFYAELVAGRSPAHAMQEAARRVREHPEHPNWAHPYYWAAFQVSGLAHEKKELA